MRSRLLTAVLLLASPVAFARYTCLESIRNTVVRSYQPTKLKGCYISNHCQIGVYLFVNRYRRLLSTIPDTQVLILRHRKENSLMWHKPALSRNNYGIPWSYHVLLMIEGQIYDMDYTETPVLVPVPEYFESFYSRPDEIDISPMTFTDYLRFMENELSMDEALAELKERVAYSDFREQYPIGP